MSTTRRHGDRAGISLLLALLAAAFIPATLDEAARARELAEARSGTSSRQPSGFHSVPAFGIGRAAAPALTDLEREAQSSIGVPSPAAIHDSARIVAGCVTDEAFLPPASFSPKRQPRGPPSS
jgi:hypothetical protein